MAERETGREHTSESGEPAAPSIGARTKIEHIPPEERLAGREHSPTDALGLDKRRNITGQTYGPTAQRVIMRFVVFFAVVGALFVGLLFLVDRLDQPPEQDKDAAPWAVSDAEQRPPVPIDARPDGAEGEVGTEQISSGSAGADQ